MMKRYVVCLPLCLLLMLWVQGPLIAQQSQDMIYGVLRTKTGTPVTGATVTLVENPSVQVVSGARVHLILRVR